MKDSQHDSTLPRINRLQFSSASASWMRQPLTFWQSQPLTSRPGSWSLLRDTAYTRDTYSSSRSSGCPRDRGPSSGQERLGVFQGQASLELSRKLGSLQVSPELSQGFTFLLQATNGGQSSSSRTPLVLQEFSCWWAQGLSLLKELLLRCQLSIPGPEFGKKPLIIWCFCSCLHFFLKRTIRLCWWPFPVVFSTPFDD